MTTEEEIIKERDKALLSLDIEEAIKTLEVAIAEVEWDYPMEYAVAFDMAIAALRAQQEAERNEPKTPCDLCMCNPPSSLDGKPCCLCPAAGKYAPKEADYEKG